MGNQVNKASAGVKSRMTIRNRRGQNVEYSQEDIKAKFDNIPKLKPDEIQVIKSSWMLIKAKGSDIGLKIFLRMYESSPETQFAFRQFRGKDFNELQDAHELRHHGEKVMESLDKIIQKIDSRKEIWELGLDLGRRHFYYGAYPMYLELMGPHFVIAVRSTIGDSWYEALEYHWLALFEMLTYIMKFGWNLKRAEEQEKARIRTDS